MFSSGRFWKRVRENWPRLFDDAVLLNGAVIAISLSIRQAFGRLTREVTRFLIVGFANTALTFVVYLALLPAIPYGWAFAVAFLCGLIFQTAMKIRVVFSSAITVRRVLRYVVYGCTFFAVNLLLLRVLVENGGFLPAIASFMTLCVMTPINFVGSRLVIAPEVTEIVPGRRNQQGASP